MKKIFKKTLAFVEKSWYNIMRNKHIKQVYREVPSNWSYLNDELYGSKNKKGGI